MRIAIAGGTGLMGGLVADESRARGHEPVLLARSTGVDLTTGAGLDHALNGADAVIDVANVNTLNADASTAFFGKATRTLLAGEQRAGVARHVALSILGVDLAPFDYYAGKRAQEVAIEAGSVPWTILRAAQFHEFAQQIYATAKAGPLHLAPKMRTQPIAGREVAARLVDLAESPARGGYVELAGPREESLVDMVRRWAHSRGHRGWIPAVALPGALGKAQRDGTLLPRDGAELGSETFTAWLERTHN
ncbi:SDR family oxidoreductase [Microbacterium sp. C7(2022)]|uniref:SDR family oxidoreductase n=1 Tax=Microbacterium sp. C7(2022) TaxID=2992759 RepID=UPI00237A2721|nr:SDR family oxidoreductase [Microbacterium sp. C7(2022)]MDE0547622.1 SDR family oxidoreductase [Microbacterium sp. C7(2022)]